MKLILKEGGQHALLIPHSGSYMGITIFTNFTLKRKQLGHLTSGSDFVLTGELGDKKKIQKTHHSDLEQSFQPRAPMWEK